jgi:hypothetical protein
MNNQIRSEVITDETLRNGLREYGLNPKNWEIIGPKKTSDLLIRSKLDQNFIFMGRTIGKMNSKRWSSLSLVSV